MDKAGLFSTDGNPIPLRGVAVSGEVIGGFARVKVRQRYANGERPTTGDAEGVGTRRRPGSAPPPVEAIYTFPLPSDATLVGFAMTCEGRRIDGVVKEREEAFRGYDDAVMDGHGAALLEQERPNVFTASVGNLLPREETLVEIEYVQRVRADEGALRWMIPTLVAPRYIPGRPAGDRTADGWADPTDRVPDADRITPRIGDVDYGLTLDLVFDLGRDVEVESPSHLVKVSREGSKTRVAFRQDEVALDRDVVVIARNVVEETLTALAAHRGGAGEPGAFALTVVPDLAVGGRRSFEQDVVFVIDVSGSMGGASLPQAQQALKLCLRHLREGDRFNVIAFESSFRSLSGRPLSFTQKTLDQADAWVDALVANGGTEMLAPLTAAVKQARDGVIILLTDGEVGNEKEILEAVLGQRATARVYSFGIGTNVSDALLRDLGKRTGGGVELIHPGERIDDKVIATFAKAVAPRVEQVRIEWEGVEVDDLAPGDPPALVDGEPWVICGRFKDARSGAAIVTGKLDGEGFRLRVPVDFTEAAERPILTKLWASERIRDLEAREVGGRREKRLRERIVELAVRHGVSSPYTAFLCVETRTGDRRTSGAPEARPIPVNVPAGWDMFKRKEQTRAKVRYYAPPATMAGGYSSAPGAPPPAPAQASAKRAGIIGRAAGAVMDMFSRNGSGGYADDIGESDAPGGAAAPADDGALWIGAPAETLEAPEPERKQEAADPIQALLQRQLASGLWDHENAARTHRGPKDVSFDLVRATTDALLALLDGGITTTHPLYGAQVRKAVDALIPLAVTLAGEAYPADSLRVAERALAVAWLAASGRRTRAEIAKAAGSLPALADLTARLGSEPEVRRHVDQLSAP